jgi:hypothetical protein
MVPVRDTAGEYLSIDEMEEHAGFKLVLPYYVPGQMMGYIAEWKQYVPGDDQSFRASVTVPPTLIEGAYLEIRIQEWVRDAPQSLHNDEGPFYLDQPTTVGETTVFCGLEPPSWTWPLPSRLRLTPVIPQGKAHAKLTCHWDNKELHVMVSFSWTLPEVLPSVITDEMREEAMKVVASMIENPYSP